MISEDLSTAQRLQMAAMLTDAVSNLIDRSKHLCYDHGTGSQEMANTLDAHATLLRQSTVLTVATLTEAIQALVPATTVKVEDPGLADDEALAGYVNATAARL